MFSHSGSEHQVIYNPFVGTWKQHVYVYVNTSMPACWTQEASLIDRRKFDSFSFFTCALVFVCIPRGHRQMNKHVFEYLFIYNILTT